MYHTIAGAQIGAGAEPPWPPHFNHWGQHRHTVMVTYPYAYMTYIVSPLAWPGRGHIVAAARLQLITLCYYIAPLHSMALTPIMFL